MLAVQEERTLQEGLQKAKKSQSQERSGYTFNPCCWVCGELGHRSADCHKRKMGNSSRLEAGVQIQAPLKLMRWNVASGTVQVKGTVDGRPCSMTVDTDVEHTFVARGMGFIAHSSITSDDMWCDRSQCATKGAQ